MSLVQFIRILRARFWIIAVATLSCVAGAYILTLILPPRWEAYSRVVLNILKPDPITGQVISGAATNTYVASQIELIKDYSVAGQVVEQLGWLTDPELIRQYNKRPASDRRDFRRWLAQFVVDRTKAAVVSGSNILEITYTGDSADNARVVADALRKAYIDTSLSFRRAEANRSTDWYADQAAKAKAAVDAAELAQTNYERENSIIMQDDKTDIETARLRAMASAGPPNVAIAGSAPALTSAASIQLADLDATISQTARELGPNNPELQQLRSKREAIAALVAAEKADAQAAAAAAKAAAAGVSALARAVDVQKSVVIGQRDKLARLSQLIAEVDFRRDEYNKMSAKLADFRREAAVADAGLTPLGTAVTPQSATFPNYPLVLGGSLVLGLGMGVLLALLIELLNRRVRGIEDLQSALDAPLLAVVTVPARGGSRRSTQRRSRGSSRTDPRKIAQA